MSALENLTSDASWGRYPKNTQDLQILNWLPKTLPNKLKLEKTILPYGLGRSYGDVCLNGGSYLLGTARLNNLISFDLTTGVLRAEAGLTIGELLKVTIPSGWFIPVTPGTQFVTLGGAVANDVHGKNHHKAGTFGCHVRKLALLRSDNKIYECCPNENSELFFASIAGLGLTGLILWVEVQLIPVKSAGIQVEHIPFFGLEEFLTLSEESANRYDYTVSWLDCTSTGKNFMRGIFMRGNHAEVYSTSSKRKITLTCPLDLPHLVLNKYTIKLFNQAYFWLNSQNQKARVVDYQPFFYPLDAVNSWNRMYGKNGFLQFQCVVPKAVAFDSITELMQIVVASGQASFLAVLKEFGEIRSPGLLSFPRAGTTLCLDFAMRGKETLNLLANLENIVLTAGGALYPAKDACMSSASFRAAFPNLEKFSKLKDPTFSSTFWRRVMEQV